MCFFAGGLRYAEQTMKSTAAQLNSSLLLIAVIAVLIPSAFHFAIQTGSDGQPALSSQTEGDDLLAMSHAVAILLLVLYLGYLIFQMWSHATLFNDDDMGPQSTRYGPEITGVKDKVKTYRFKRNRHRGGTDKSKVEDEEGGMMPVSTTTTTTTGSNTTRGDMTGSPEMMPTDLAPESSIPSSGATTAHQQLQGGRTKEFNDGPVQIPTGPRGARAADEESEEEEEEPQMNIWATLVCLLT
jgi:Ca2+:H+ antiporter